MSHSRPRFFGSIPTLIRSAPIHAFRNFVASKSAHLCCGGSRVGSEKTINRNAGDPPASTVLAVTRHLPGTPACHAEALSVGGSLGEGGSLHQMKIILETERLVVREYEEEDAAAFFKLKWRSLSLTVRSRS